MPLHEMALAKITLFFSIIPIDWSLQHTLNTQIIKKFKMAEVDQIQPDALSLIVANTADIPAQGLIFSKGTCSLVQWKSPFLTPHRGLTS